ncbi:MAG: hypothetical protein KGO05_06120, partial [Chloroflexota bacterium]|nr:hypothetical protein [Chloroflexota bacterium]
IERLRAELAEALAATVAYPPFFDFRANRPATRPIDRARMDEIQHFLGSVNFNAIERADASAADTRRFIERLIARYVEVNEGLRGRFAARYIPRLQATAPRLAAEVQRRMVGHLNGGVPDFGARRQAYSWTSVSRHEARRSPEERERATRVLESALLQRANPSDSAVSAPDWQAPPADATVPVPASAFTDSAPAGSPFAAFRDTEAPQRGPLLGLTEQPTGPMLAQPASPPANPSFGRSALREAPPDLVELYGDYLNDMAPEAPRSPQPPAPSPPPSPPPSPAPPPRPAPARRDPPAPRAEANPNARNDLLIFWQLRYQLEAYIRRAARNYGLSQQSGDPATVLDTLRRSGYVDEADLRIAEGIFALTDRVTGQGHASEQEYRQALMLYLLYHRSHLNL